MWFWVKFILRPKAVAVRAAAQGVAFPPLTCAMAVALAGMVCTTCGQHKERTSSYKEKPPLLMATCTTLGLKRFWKCILRWKRALVAKLHKATGNIHSWFIPWSQGIDYMTKSQVWSGICTRQALGRGGCYLFSLTPCPVMWDTSHNSFSTFITLRNFFFQ